MSIELTKMQRGIMTYVSLNGVLFLVQVASGGRILPADSELKEAWNCELDAELAELHPN